MEPIELIEYEPRSISRDVLPLECGQYLWQKFGSVLSVVPPSFITKDSWQLTSEGWVGQIPVQDGPGLYLRPRLALGNLFLMWEYAYRLEQFRFLEGMAGCDSLDAFYENLAGLLAGRVLDRARKGFYRAYLPETDRLPFLRGRMDTRRAVTQPWDVNLQCSFEEHTGDVEENQILAWTLRKVARNSICREEVRGRVRGAYRALRSFVGIHPFKGQDCSGRLYSRLNCDYHPLHALCRFFLESTGPAHEIGDQDMVPFLVSMPYLFELFVAEWLKKHLPARFTLKPQYTFRIDQAGSFTFRPDLVIYEKSTGNPCCVLDTKYKVPAKPSMDDIAKVAAYGLGLGCKEAMLVYPSVVPKGIDDLLGGVRVRSVHFILDGDLESNGQRFLEDILVNSGGD